MKEELEQMKRELEAELGRNLDFWERVSYQPQTGIFLTLGCDDETLSDGKRSGVLLCRVLWAYSSAAVFTGEERYRTLADAAYEDIREHFLDSVGGCLETLERDGGNSQEPKRTYTQWYLIYGMCKYFRASGKEEALDTAVATYRYLQDKAFDQKSGTYRTLVEEEGGLLELDTFLHALESLASLYRLWPDESLKENLIQVMKIVAGRFLRADGGLYQVLSPSFQTVGDESDRFADDAEGCWMLWEAATALGQEEIRSFARRAAGRMMDHVAREGLDEENGGVIDRAYPDREPDTEKMWWEESESILGFLYAAQVTGEERFVQAALDTWSFLKKYILDEGGGWNWKVTREGERIFPEDPSSPLKCPYHSTRLVTLGVPQIEKLLQMSFL